MAVTEQDIESHLSYAYLHAVAARAGFVCRAGTHEEDKEGIDAVVTAYGQFPTSTWRTQVTINVQLKATVRQPADDGTFLSYSIQGVRRFDKLRADHREPVRLMVVLFLPADRADWLTITTEQLALKRCAYWASLRNAPPSENQTGQTVKIPKTQIISPDSLTQLVHRLAGGQYIPEYIQP